MSSGSLGLIAEAPAPARDTCIIGAGIAEVTTKRGALERELRLRSFVNRIELGTGILAGRDQARPCNYRCEPNRRSHCTPRRRVSVGVTGRHLPQTSVPGCKSGPATVLILRLIGVLVFDFLPTRRRLPSGGQCDSSACSVLFTAR